VIPQQCGSKVDTNQGVHLGKSDDMQVLFRKGQAGS
jgi:hypothetical protein